MVPRIHVNPDHVSAVYEFLEEGEFVADIVLISGEKLMVKDSERNVKSRIEAYQENK